MENYLFPGESHMHWSMMIVLYPYLTGLVAGSFFLSTLYYVFGIDSLKSVARLGLLVAFSFLLFAAVPLLLHLGRPERAFNIMLTPNFMSAMAGFGYIYTACLFLLVVMIWLVVRPEIVSAYNSSSGFKKTLFGLLALRQTSPISEASRALDKKALLVMGAVGIPAFFILTGYVGFIFGSLKANLWWSTALMPVVFILSAIVSGASMAALVYIFLLKDGAGQKTLETVRTVILVAFLVDIALETLDYIHHMYKSGEEWAIIKATISDKLMLTYIIGQLNIFSLIPIGLLFYSFGVKDNDRLRKLISISSFMLLIQVLLMRWNIVIGGQYFSKSHRGVLDFEFHVLGREGFLMVLVVFALPFVVMFLVNRVFPMLKKEQGDSTSL